MADASGALVAPVPASPEAEAALEVLAAGSKSFSFAGLFLPPDRRAEAALLYALCRHVDDVADDAVDVPSAAAGLARLDAELDGAPTGSLLTAVRSLFARRDIDPAYAHALVEGVRSDLQLVRVADDAALIRYAYRVAGTVGLMMCGVLGVRDRRALPFAVDLGVAMQITNICRDVREDALKGRVYLPATRLVALGVDPTPEGVLDARDAVRHVVADLVALSERYYRSAEDGMRYIPWRARLAILVAARVYRAIGVRLAAAGCDALAGRTVVPTAGKVLAALGALGAFVRASTRRGRHSPALHTALAGWPGADPAAVAAVP